MVGLGSYVRRKNFWGNFTFSTAYRTALPVWASRQHWPNARRPSASSTQRLGNHLLGFTKLLAEAFRALGFKSTLADGMPLVGFTKIMATQCNRADGKSPLGFTRNLAVGSV